MDQINSEYRQILHSGMLPVNLADMKQLEESDPEVYVR